MDLLDSLFEQPGTWTSVRTRETFFKFPSEKTEDIIHRLKNLQSFQSRLNRIKITVVFLIFISIGYTFLHYKIISPFAVTGILISAGATIAFFSYYLSHQFRISRLPFGASTSQFLESALQQLYNQKKVFGLPFRLFTLTLLLGLNIFLLGMVEGSFLERLQVHAALSLWVMLSSEAGMRIRTRRTKKEVEPIINDLQRLKRSWTKEDTDLEN